MSDMYSGTLSGIVLLFEILLKKRYSVHRLLATFRIFYGRHKDLITKYDSCDSHMSEDLFSISVAV